MAEMNAGGVLFDNQLLGCLKDEGAVIAAKLSKKHSRKITGRFKYYVGVAPKTYSVVWVSDCGEYEYPICKAKGIPGNVLKKLGGYDKYVEQLENPHDTSVTYHKLLIDQQRMYLQETTRRGICAVDTKSFRVDDNTSLPLGHWRIRNFLRA